MAKKRFVAAVLTCGTYHYALAVPFDFVETRVETRPRKTCFTPHGRTGNHNLRVANRELITLLRYNNPAKIPTTRPTRISISSRQRYPLRRSPPHRLDAAPLRDEQRHGSRDALNR